MHSTLSLLRKYNTWQTSQAQSQKVNDIPTQNKSIILFFKLQTWFAAKTVHKQPVLKQSLCSHAETRASAQILSRNQETEKL